MKDNVRMPFLNLWACLAVFALLIGILSTGIYWGAQLHKDRWVWEFRTWIHDLRSQHISIFSNYINSSTEPLEHLNLEIQPKRLKALLEKRRSPHQLTEADREKTYRVHFEHEDTILKGKIQLTGGQMDHFNSDKISMTVKLSKSKFFNGMRRFNLAHPKVRYGVYEWVGHQLSQREGLIALRFGFINLSINGKPQGVYLQEERFTQEMIVYNNRREGIVFSDKNNLHIYQRKKWDKTSEGKARQALLKRLFDGLRSGSLKADQVFDVELMAKHFAISDLMDGIHSLYGGNTHFYFNPVTARVEPIGREWDAHPYSPMETMVALYLPHTKESFVGALFQDLDFFKRYVHHLERLSSQEYIDRFYNEIQPQLKRYLSALHQEYPAHNFSKAYLFRNSQFIHEQLSASPSALTATLQTSPKQTPQIAFTNHQSFPLQILRIFDASGKEYSLDEQLVIPSKKAQATPHFLSIETWLSNTVPHNSWQVEFTVLGTYRPASTTLQLMKMEHLATKQSD